MNPIEQLKSVLCDPEGKCCIAGSDEDRAIIDRALQALATQPAQRKPLTDEEIYVEAEKEEQAHGFILGAMWAETKLREKNT